MAVDLAEALVFVRAHDRGVLVTLRRDGRPQLSNIVYVPDEDNTIRISLTESRAKTKNLRRDPRASLHVTREDFFAYVVLDGTVELSSVATEPGDPVVDSLVDLYRAARGEHPDWDEYRQAMVDEGRVLARFRVERAYGMLAAP
ncbi:MAG TPA: PPOX class F420-dependent oxidoreductase [Acidimicrobiales bacterium]|jgi:PPOX class probable F420-dependent enzyme|nr:PPOX class F420-dependent oxidoreductase [Acidimicrobiales bacterium]